MLPAATPLCQHQCIGVSREHWGSHQLHTRAGTPQLSGDGLRRGPTSGSVKEAPEPGRTGLWAGWQCKGCGQSLQAQLSMQSSWVSSEERWSLAQPQSHPAESCLAQGAGACWAHLHTGALQIPRGRASTAVRAQLRVMLPQLLPSARVPLMVMRSSHFPLLVLLPAAQVIAQKLPWSCSGPLWGVGWTWPCRASPGNVSWCKRRARMECGSWLIQGRWSSPSLGYVWLWPLAGGRQQGHCSNEHTPSLEGRRCSIDPVPAALKRALLTPAGLAGLSLCHSSSGAALAAGHCQPHTFASNFANSACPPVHPQRVQRCLAEGHKQRGGMLPLILLCCRQVRVTSLPPPSPGRGALAVQICSPGCPCSPQGGQL